MAYIEHDSLPCGNLKSTTSTRKLESQGTDCNRTKSFQNRPSISSQKPVLRRFEAQINQAKQTFNCEIPTQRKQVKLSVEDNKEIHKSEAQQTVPKHKQEGSSLILERIQKLKNTQLDDEVLKKFNDKSADKKIGEETPTTPQECKDMASEKKKETNSDKDTKTADTKSDQTTKFYKCLPIQNSNGRTPRKPARPPTVNLDFMKNNATPNASFRPKREHFTLSRPISELTEEQENEETKSYSNQIIRQVEDDELYQELE